MLRRLLAFLDGGKCMKCCISQLDFLVWQILGIVGSQIEIEKIFLSAGILINLRRCHL
jgi:hypothetical protein